MFSKIILKENKGFSEVRVLFDRYDELSLKSKNREDRTSGVQIQYKVEDDTNIENIIPEIFLSLFNTKRDLQNIKVAKLLKYCQLLENEMLVPTTLLLNQTLSVFQKN